MKKLRVFAVGLAVILFVTAAAAMAKNVQLKNKHDRDLAGMESRVMVPVGTVVPSFWAFNRFDGSKETKITKRTILAVFSPTCAACETNWSNWEAIQSEADKRGVRLLFVNLSSQMAPEFVSTHSMRDFLSEPDPRLLTTLQLVLTPETIAVDEQGTVRGAWIGVLSGAQKQQVLEFLASGEIARGLR